tara:strand:+ start:56902 stop:57114 length:213 start_codon:yes stop_codon:yes gene_type:complete
MSITLKMVELVDKLRLTQLFIEENNRVHLKFTEFNPQKLEVLLDAFIKTRGKEYNPDEFELNCIRELENV